METVCRTIYHIVATRKVYSIGIFSLYSLLFILEHRARTTTCSFHLLAALLASSQIMLMVFNYSACRVLFQVKHGLSLLHFPCGFQSKAWRVMLTSLLLACTCSMSTPLSTLDGVSQGFLLSSLSELFLLNTLWPSNV